MSNEAHGAATPTTTARLEARADILKWLMEETWRERFLDKLFTQLCERLPDAGVYVDRATMHFVMQHPQWLGVRVLWKAGMKEAAITRFDHGLDNAPQYLMSPTREIIDGTDEIRAKLRTDAKQEYEVFDLLASEGFTEYVAWPLLHTLGQRHMISFATKAACGFSEEAYDFLRSLIPPLAMLSEIRAKNVLARTLLQTYVGPRAAEEILAGSITRGSGDTLRAAIMICDMRDFTTLSNLWPRDDVIGLLNAYFDALCVPVEENGGEILKFMGDGMLAIFPLDKPNAAERLIQAVRDANKQMADLNERNSAANKPLLRYGVGVHLGDVMYGNIGSEGRLDFTVIGPAVNLAARLEALTKVEGRPVLISSDFVETFRSDGAALFELVGSRNVKGIDSPVEIYGLR